MPTPESHRRPLAVLAAALACVTVAAAFAQPAWADPPEPSDPSPVVPSASSASPSPSASASASGAATPTAASAGSAPAAASPSAPPAPTVSTTPTPSSPSATKPAAKPAAVAVPGVSTLTLRVNSTVDSLLSTAIVVQGSSDLAGRPVQVQVMSSRWSGLVSGNLDASGRFVTSFTYLIGSTGTFQLRAVTPAVDGELASNVAATTRVRQRTVPLEVTSTVNALKTTPMTVRANVNLAGWAVQVQVMTTRWSGLTSGTLNAQGMFTSSFGYDLGALRGYSLRAVLTSPRGIQVITPTASVSRIAVLDAVVTPTTSAEVAYTYRAGCPVGPSGLSTIAMNYIGYDNRLHRGALIVKSSLASKVVSAFGQGMSGRFPIRLMRNPDFWKANDVSMMSAGNTSAFNCRRVTGNPYALSPHSYGTAIDVNTIENPYRDPNGRWYPSTTYASNRPASVKGLLTSSSSLTRGLKGQGFAWYSGWDWQHFQA